MNNTVSLREQINSLVEDEELWMPEKYIDYFIEFRQNKNNWFDSDKLYDEIFYDKYGRYDNFIKAIKKHLIINEDYKVAYTSSPEADLNNILLQEGERQVGAHQNEIDLLHGGGDEYHQRKNYKISYTGLQKMEMTNNKEIQCYFIHLEIILDKIITQQEALEEQQNESQQLQIEQQLKLIDDLKKEVDNYKIVSIENMESGKIFYACTKANEESISKNYFGEALKKLKNEKPNIMNDIIETALSNNCSINNFESFYEDISIYYNVEIEHANRMSKEAAHKIERELIDETPEEFRLNHNKK